MVRCFDCQKPVVNDTKYMQWLKLYDFISFLSLEGYIEVATRDEILDATMVMKEWATEEEPKKTCPCEFEEVEPCTPNCSCANAFRDGGCLRCAKYGSHEQQVESAKRLAGILSEG